MSFNISYVKKSSNEKKTAKNSSKDSDSKNSSNKMSLQDSFKQIFGFIRDIKLKKRWLGVLIGFAVLNASFGLVMGHGLRSLVNFASMGEWGKAKTGLCLFAAVLLIENIYRVFFPLVLTNFDQNTQMLIRNGMLKYIFLDYKKLRLPGAKGNYLESVMNDVKKVTSLLTGLINAFIEYPISALITIVYLIWTSNVLMLAIGISGSIFSWMVAKRVGAQLSELSIEERERVGRFHHFVQECFNSIAIWKLEKPFKWVQAKNTDFHNNIRKLRLSKQQRLIWSNIFQMEFADTLTRLIIIIVGVILIFNHQANVGDILAFVFLFHRIGKPFQNMFDYFNRLNSQMGPLEKVKSYFDQGNLAKVDDKEYREVNHIKFRNVGISVDKNFLFEVKEMVLRKGTVTCIRGENGTGKTTLINTLLGHSHNFRGSIYIDGLKLEPGDAKNYRHLFSVMEQDAFIFMDTLKENITLGQTYTGEKDRLEKIMNALELDKVIHENGWNLDKQLRNNLSSGQRKLIALCRAFYRKAPIIILDEPTESLDVYKVAALKKYIDDIKRDHIIIIITHDNTMLGITNNNLIIKENKLLIEVGRQDNDKKVSNTN